MAFRSRRKAGHAAASKAESTHALIADLGGPLTKLEDYAGDAEPGNLRSGPENLRSQLKGQLVMQETVRRRVETRGPRSSYLVRLEKIASLLRLY